MAKSFDHDLLSRISPFVFPRESHTAGRNMPSLSLGRRLVLCSIGPYDFLKRFLDGTH
jgi:hypothetical protein